MDVNIRTWGQAATCMATLKMSHQETKSHITSQLVDKSRRNSGWLSAEKTIKISLVLSQQWFGNKEQYAVNFCLGKCRVEHVCKWKLKIQDFLPLLIVPTSVNKLEAQAHCRTNCSWQILQITTDLAFVLACFSHSSLVQPSSIAVVLSPPCYCTTTAFWGPVGIVGELKTNSRWAFRMFSPIPSNVWTYVWNIKYK
jgi:hypothetical protein